MYRNLSARIIATIAACLCVTALSGRAVGAVGQGPQGPDRLPQVLVARGAAGVAGFDERRAEDVRQELRAILNRYPPALGRVLKLDPTLMTSDAYLKPYPALAEFLQRHPEVPRYPDYFLDFVDFGSLSNQSPPRDFNPRQGAMRMWEDVLAGLGVLTGFFMAALTLTWLVKYIVGHRRWLRATKIQSDIHGRLLERLSSNEEFMAYIQSPAGSHFLKAMPVVSEASATVGAPLGRILWSAQAGLVLISAGVGLLYIKHYVIEEVGQMLLVMGVLVISVGIGFVLAGAASYVLSRRLGLLDGLVRPANSGGA